MDSALLGEPRALATAENYSEFCLDRTPVAGAPGSPNLETSIHPLALILPIVAFLPVLPPIQLMPETSVSEEERENPIRRFGVAKRGRLGRIFLKAY